jgi:serine/threonine-protein kinase RsbW
MEVQIALRLPRDAASVPVARQALTSCLHTLNVDAGTCDDLALALGEACANVIKHATASDEYKIQIGIADHRCVIEVIDTGRGLDFQAVQTPAPPTSEHGRGLQIMTALVDNFSLSNLPRQGTLVHFEKLLDQTSL